MTNKTYYCDTCGRATWSLIELDHVARCDECHQAWLKVCHANDADCIACEGCKQKAECHG